MENNLCWLRRDLRLTDHLALAQSLRSGTQTYVIFIFDPHILAMLPNNDRRITFIIESLIDIEIELNKYHSSLILAYGNPSDELSKIIKKYNITNLYFNRDYEPFSKKRDDFVISEMQKKKVNVFHFKDHVFYEKNEVLTDKREIYKVFTPYKNKWLQNFKATNESVNSYHCDLKKLAKVENENSILNYDWFKHLSFTKQNNELKGGRTAAVAKINDFKKYIHEYNIARDFPALEKTSKLSPYIRMGNISIREMISLSLQNTNLGSKIWLNELIWRDFYQVILDVYPRVQNTAFKLEYNQLKWENNNELFESWCKGNTGYPIVDAAMRCLNDTGLMHNRLRMVVACFLTKTLLIDWRKGEEYFALKLLDFDLAANNGGWQWSASTGVDAQPYFRIFNPYNQSEKFDSNGEFIKLWCPELRHFSKKHIHFPHEAEYVDQVNAQCMIGRDYPHPIVAYKTQKEKALNMFKAIKSEN